MSASFDQKDLAVLLDDQTLYAHVQRALRDHLKHTFSGRKTSHKLSPFGVGFARGTQFQINGKNRTLLCLDNVISDPFSYLTLGAIATLGPHPDAIVCFTAAHSLREDLFPGDLAVVAKASAVPYPALFASQDPYANAQAGTEEYAASRNAVEAIVQQLHQNGSEYLWQRNIKVVRSGYAKHPTWNGELMPWDPEQLQRLRDKGLDTISSSSVGVYAAQHLFRRTEIICINQIKTTLNVDSEEQWRRFGSKLHQPALGYLTSLLLT